MVIEYDNVSVKRSGRMVLKNVSLRIDEGEFVYLVGRVGSGKSTLLKTMYGEVDITEGEASVLDFDMRKTKRNRLQSLRRQIGVVFQDFQLLMNRSVNQNLDFVLRATGWKNAAERRQRIEDVLSLVDMEGHGDDMPYALSGGEQQRVCIARALLNSPRLILADEPTGNLDSETAFQVTSLLHHIAISNNTAVLFSTHNEGLFEDFPARVLRCIDGEIVDENED